MAATKPATKPAKKPVRKPAPPRRRPASNDAPKEARLLPAVLSGKQSRALKGLAHHLEPVVSVGKDGVTDGVLSALSQALTDHELVKVRLPQVDKGERHALALALAEGAPAHLVGELGRIAILYRRHPSRPKVSLPAA